MRPTLVFLPALLAATLAACQTPGRIVLAIRLLVGSNRTSRPVPFRAEGGHGHTRVLNEPRLNRLGALL